MRGETIVFTSFFIFCVFQSTPLMRGETRVFDDDDAAARDFNPLPSCEGRPLLPQRPRGRPAFQSTPLMRGETLLHYYTREIGLISIHSPHARGDASGIFVLFGFLPFQSTPLMRGETNPVFDIFDNIIFQSTPLMRGETAIYFLCSHCSRFQSTPLMRGETC